MIMLILKKANGDMFDITQLVSKVTWSGDINACSRKLEFSIISSATDINIPKIDIPLSSLIIFYEDNKELFRGFVFEREKSSDSTTMDFLCYDYAEKLNKIKVSYNIKDKYPHDIMGNALKDYGFRPGKIAPGTVKVKKVFIGTSMYELIQTAYTEQSKKDSKKYMLYADKDTINSTIKGITVLKTKFEEGQNIISSNYKESITNMVNKVLIVDENGNKKSEVKDDNLLKVHGLFQDIYKVEEGKDSTTEAKAMLNGVEKTCSLSGFGDTSCVTGYGVEVKDTYTGLTGKFFIDSDTHSWDGGNYKINLQLNFQNIMNEVEAGEDEQDQTTSNTGDSTTVSGGKEVKAEFTAYYPANNSMQGGFLDAMGNRLDPSKLTCAAPKSVPFKTKIQVKGTGTSRDNLVYTCTDRGGAIVIDSNGVYHIDLLMSSKKEAYAFGRRKGTAIIGVEVTNNSNSSSNGNSNSDKLITEVKKHLGKKYVWGATGPNTFDCSGLTSYVYKKALGISIPRTSGEQRKGGKSINKSNALPGDIVCFDGHVGMYVGNGQMIHAPNPKKPVKYDPCFSGYWGNKLLAIRRYW